MSVMGLVGVEWLASAARLGLLRGVKSGVLREQFLHLAQAAHLHPGKGQAPLAAPEVAAALGWGGLEQQPKHLPRSFPARIERGADGLAGRAALQAKTELGEPLGHGSKQVAAVCGGIGWRRSFHRVWQISRLALLLAASSIQTYDNEL